MTWRSVEVITKNLIGCIEWQSLPPPFEAEFKQVMQTCLTEIAQEVFKLEKKIWDLEHKHK